MGQEIAEIFTSMPWYIILPLCLGVVFLFIECFIPGFGFFGVSGLVCLVGGIIANAVITKDVPPYTIWAGVPARQINVRFKKDISDRLLKIKWWDWPKEKLNKAKDLFDMEINEDIIDKLEIIGKEL